MRSYEVTLGHRSVEDTEGSRSKESVKTKLVDLRMWRLTLVSWLQHIMASYQCWYNHQTLAPNNIVSVEKSVLTTHGGRGGRRVQLLQDTFLHPPEDALLLLLLLLASWGVVTLGSSWHHWLLHHHGHHLARVQVTLHLRIHLTWQGKRLWLAWTGKTETKNKKIVCVCSDKLK